METGQLIGKLMSAMGQNRAIRPRSAQCPLAPTADIPEIARKIVGADGTAEIRPAAPANIRHSRRCA